MQFSLMSAVVEIESAIQKLSEREVEELAVWLDEYRAMNNAAGKIAAMDDCEESSQT